MPDTHGGTDGAGDVRLLAGALLLFGAVQITMLGYGFWRGERLSAWQMVGLVCACGALPGLRTATAASVQLSVPLQAMRWTRPTRPHPWRSPCHVQTTPRLF